MDEKAGWETFDLLPLYLVVDVLTSSLIYQRPFHGAHVVKPTCGPNDVAVHLDHTSLTPSALDFAVISLGDDIIRIELAAGSSV